MSRPVPRSLSLDDPHLPGDLRELVARSLANPRASSDLVLWIAEAMAELAAWHSAHGRVDPALSVGQLALELREAAPFYAQETTP